MRSNNWRFNQSYAERQQAYLQGVSSSHHHNPAPVPSPRKPRNVSNYAFPKKGLECPSTPPNTSRTRSETSLDDYRILVNSNHSSDTESTDFLFEGSSGGHRIGTANANSYGEVEYRYLQEPSGHAAQYYRTTYNRGASSINKKAPSDRGDAPKVITETKNNRAQKEASNPGSEKQRNDPSTRPLGYKPISFGYIPAIVPEKCGPPHRTKSNHGGHGKQAKPAKAKATNMPNLSRNY